MTLYSALTSTDEHGNALLSITDILTPDSTSVFTLAGNASILVSGSEIPTVMTFEGSRRRFYVFDDGVHCLGSMTDCNTTISRLYGAYRGGFPLFSSSGPICAQRICSLNVSDGILAEKYVACTGGDVIWCCGNLWNTVHKYNGKDTYSMQVVSLTDRAIRETVPRVTYGVSSVNMNEWLISYTYVNGGGCRLVCDDCRSVTEAASVIFDNAGISQAHLSVKWIDDRTVAVISKNINKPVSLMDIRNSKLYTIPCYQTGQRELASPSFARIVYY